MKRFAAGLAIATTMIFAQPPKPVSTGPAIGSLVPGFTASDQDGNIKTLKSVLGPKGGLLVFFRSADW